MTCVTFVGCVSDCYVLVVMVELLWSLACYEWSCHWGLV